MIFSPNTWSDHWLSLSLQLIQLIHHLRYSLCSLLRARPTLLLYELIMNVNDWQFCDTRFYQEFHVEVEFSNIVNGLLLHISDVIKGFMYRATSLANSKGLLPVKQDEVTVFGIRCHNESTQARQQPSISSNLLRIDQSLSSVDYREIKIIDHILIACMQGILICKRIAAPGLHGNSILHGRSLAHLRCCTACLCFV